MPKTKFPFAYELAERMTGALSFIEKVAELEPNQDPDSVIRLRNEALQLLREIDPEGREPGTPETSTKDERQAWLDGWDHYYRYDPDITPYNRVCNMAGHESWPTAKLIEDGQRVGVFPIW